MEFLRKAMPGSPSRSSAGKHGFSDVSYYLWRGKFDGVSVRTPGSLNRARDLVSERALVPEPHDAEVVIEAWRRAYNDERPRDGVG